MTFKERAGDFIGGFKIDVRNALKESSKTKVQDGFWNEGCARKENSSRDHQAEGQHEPRGWAEVVAVRQAQRWALVWIPSQVRLSLDHDLRDVWMRRIIDIEGWVKDWSQKKWTGSTDYQALRQLNHLERILLEESRYALDWNFSEENQGISTKKTMIGLWFHTTIGKRQMCLTYRCPDQFLGKPKIEDMWRQRVVRA